RVRRRVNRVACRRLPGSRPAVEPGRDLSRGVGRRSRGGIDRRGSRDGGGRAPRVKRSGSGRRYDSAQAFGKGQKGQTQTIGVSVAEPRMSRMFNVLSGGAQLRKAEPAPVSLAAAPVEEIPFVEIGDPKGPIFSPALNVLKLAPDSAKAEEPAPVDRTFPRLATQKYLSVKFHDLTERARHDAAREGPDAGLVAFHIPDHPVSGEYRTLRDAVGGQLPEMGPKVLWFTAAAAEAGTTSVMLNLAITIARDASKRVVVVDANAERPAVAEKFALGAAAPGLAEVLAEKTPL